MWVSVSVGFEPVTCISYSIKTMTTNINIFSIKTVKSEKHTCKNTEDTSRSLTDNSPQ